MSGDLTTISKWGCDILHYYNFLKGKFFILNMLKTSRSRSYTLTKDPWMIFHHIELYLNMYYTFYDGMHTSGVYFSLCTRPFVRITFNIWIRKGALDTLVFIIKFLTLDCKPNHMTIGLFETIFFY